MLKIFVMKKRSLYIALILLIVIIAGIILFLSGSDETFSETMKYAYKQISAEQAKVLLEKNPDAIVFDMRDEKEYLQSHLPSATQLSHKELKKNLDYYNREQIYMIYSSDDKKSAEVADMMASNGFCKIYMLTGGIESWSCDIE